MLIIREAVPDELCQVREMIERLARHHGDEARISLDDLRARVFGLGQGRLWVAAEEEGLVGYALLLTRPNMVTGGVGHVLDHLFVVDWRRRAGIGRTLIAAAQAYSRDAGAEFLMIGTHRDNLGAQNAYRGMGLEEVPQPGPRFKVALIP